MSEYAMASTSQIQMMQQQQLMQDQQQLEEQQLEDAAAPPVPQIRIAAASRSKAAATPLPQMRSAPEPYGTHEFQPKTPDRSRAPSTPAAQQDGMIETTYMEAPFQSGQDQMAYHNQFQQAGQFTPRHPSYVDPNLQHVVHDPAMLQQQLQQQLLQQQQQQMYNPMQQLMTPTHGMGVAPHAAASNAALAGRPGSSAGFPPRGGQNRAPMYLNQDPMQHMLEEERERKREQKLQKNRDAAREGREKKRRYQMLLEARVSILETQNRALIEELKALKFLFCKPSQAMQQQQQQQHMQQQQQQMHMQPGNMTHLQAHQMQYVGQQILATAR